ncbi:GrpB family protein [Alkalicoccus urumqiensis]|uniref:GrpB family protein n=1 Tax=Alkalicoccus urumqiensis TaxID=1548213 RepID=UPI0015E5DB9F|nr:GrpB family protein [Alkalicoccus urumqiensis]
MTPRRVEVTPYQAEWPHRFEEEKQRLENVFQGKLISLHHIGSTSVTGLPAKPTIDIMGALKRLEDADQMEEKLEELGYTAYGEHHMTGRRFFTREAPDGRRLVHLHLFEENSPHLERHLAFRDYLRCHPEARRRYGGLKQSLAWEYPFNMKAYIEGKEDVVKELEAGALKWYRKKT